MEPMNPRRSDLVRRARTATVADAPDFLDALRDPDPEVRQAAAWGLDQVGDPSLIKDLLPHLFDPHPLVQSAVGWALVHTGPEAIVPMRAFYDSLPAGPTRMMAHLVLERLGAPPESPR